MAHSLRQKSTSHTLLQRMLDEPDLVTLVQTLEPPQLARVIEHVGLEDASEILQFATTTQLASVIDDDVWRAAFPGQDPSFDAARFLLWLEVMLECGEDWLADKLVELPEDLVTLAFARHLLVLDLEELSVWLSPDEDSGDLTEKAFSNCPSEEFDEYVVIGRQHEGWDNLLSVLLALDKNHHGYLDRVLSRCRQMSHDFIEDNGGLYDVLSAEDSLTADLLGEHEARRSARGFIAGRRAAHFLELSIRTAPSEVLASRDEDPITRAYFRELEHGPGTAAAGHPPRGSRPEERNAAVAEPRRRLLAAIDESAAEPPPDSSVGARERPVAPVELPFQRAMALLLERDSSLHARRLEELAYLANVLISAAEFDGRRWRSFDAASAALAWANRGLEHVLSLLPDGLTEAIETQVAVAALTDHSATRLFRVGRYLRKGERVTSVDA